MLDIKQNTSLKNKWLCEFLHSLFFWSILLYLPSYTGLEFVIYLFFSTLVISAYFGIPNIAFNKEFLFLMFIALIFSVFSTLNHLLFYTLHFENDSLDKLSIGFAPKILRSILTYIFAMIYINHFKFGKNFILGMCAAMFLGSIATILQVLYPDIQFITGNIFNYAQITSGTFTEPQRGHGFSNSSDVASLISAILGIFLCCLFRSTDKNLTSYFLILLIVINLIAAIFSARVGFILGVFFLLLSSRVSIKLYIYISILIIFSLLSLKILIDNQLLMKSFVYNIERTLDFPRLLNESIGLINLGLSDLQIINIIIGNGVLPYVGPNKFLGDMQYGQLLSGIGLMGTFAIVLAVIFPCISFFRNTRNHNHLDKVSFVCISFLTLIASIKGPYLLSRPIFDIFIIIMCFYTCGGSFTVVNKEPINAVQP
jgi:hypothetical protein